MTVLQALYDLLMRTGWVTNKQEFARLLRIHEGNIYRYLMVPGQAERIRASIESLHAWCVVISKHTGIAVTLRLCPDGSTEIVAKGMRKDDLPVREEVQFLTSDLTPPDPWAEDWERLLRSPPVA